MSYHIIYRGELQPGLSRQETIERLAKLSKLTPEQAEQRFFRGKPVRIKAFEDRAAAERFVEQLSGLGIVAGVVEQPSGAGQQPSAVATRPKPSSQAVAVPARPFSPRHRRLLWGAGAAVVLLLAMAGAGVWYANGLFDTSVPAIVNRAENTLLSNEAVLLGHANVSQMAKLERVVAGSSEADRRPDPEGEGLINGLLLEGVDLRRDLQQVVFSLNVDPEHGGYMSAVLATTAEPQAIRRYIEKSYELESEQREGLEVLTFRKLDRDLCRYSESQAAILADGLVVLSHPAKVVSLYQALMAADAGKAVDQRWVDYRSQRLFSLGILEPKQMEGQPLPGIASFLLMGLRSEWDSMESLFAGAKGSLVPPSLSVDVTVNSQDAQWVADSKAALEQRLNELEPKAGNFLDMLVSKVGVEGDAHSIGAVFTVDGALVDAGKRAMKEGIGNIVSLAGGSMGGSMSAGAGEQIDEDPQVYLASFALADLPTFENKYGDAYQWIEGPLAARLNSVGINRDGLTTLELVVATAEMPNAPDSSFGKRGELTVHDVVDAGGNSLLQVETCGTDLNQDAADFDFIGRATKRVRLKAGKSLADVAAIKAQVTMRIPTETKTERLTLPLATTTFEQGETYLRIKNVGQGAVGFLLSGGEGGFLNLRALNAKGQYLQSGGGMSFGNSAEKRFQGEIHSLELVRALDYHEQQYAIELTATGPAYKEGSFARAAVIPAAYNLEDWPEVLRLAGEQAYKKADAQWWGEPVAISRGGPAELSLFGPEVDSWMREYRFKASMKVSMPYVKALEASHQRAHLHIKELQFSGEPALMQDVLLPLKFSFAGFENNFMDSSKSEAELRKDIYLSGDLRVATVIAQSETPAAERSFESLRGELVFNLPTALESQTLSPIRLGDFIVGDGFVLRVVGLGTDSLKLQLTGDGSRLVSLQLLDAQDKLLAEGIEFSEESRRNGIKPNHRDEPEPAPRTLGDLRFFGGEPAKLVVVTAKETVTERYPVALEIGEL